MNLLEAMLPYYIKILEKYVNNKNVGFLFRTVLPNEAHLAITKKTLAIDLLTKLYQLNNSYVEQNLQDLHSAGDDENSIHATARASSAKISESEVRTHGGFSPNTPNLNIFHSGTSPILSLVSSFRNRNNTDELRNKMSASEYGSVNRSQGTYEGGLHTGDTVSTYNTAAILEEYLSKQIVATDSARKQHSNHKPGSYDAILSAMLDNLQFIKMRMQHMLTNYHINQYSAKHDLQVFNATYRDNLYRIVHLYLCVLSFDKSLYGSKLATPEQKSMYFLSGCRFQPKNLVVINDIEYNLLNITNGVFSPDYAQTQQFIKTLADYTLTLEQIQRLPDLAPNFTAQLVELKSDLAENLALTFPFVQDCNNIETVIARFIQLQRSTKIFSLSSVYFANENDTPVNSPYPSISRM